MWGQGLCQEKSLNPSEPGLLAVTRVTTLYTGGGGGVSIIQHVGKPVTREGVRGKAIHLGKIPITHIRVPGLINFIMPNPTEMIEFYPASNIHRPNSQMSGLLLFICLPSDSSVRAQVMFCSCKYFCEDQTLGRLMFPIPQ